MAISSAYSSNLSTAFSGQPGNALPLVGPSASQVVALNYGLSAGFRRPVNTITLSSVASTIGSSWTGSMIYFMPPAATNGGQEIITLPNPQPGLWFEFAGIGAHVSSAALLFNCVSATGAFYCAGDSGGTDGVVMGSTLAPANLRIEFIGISTAKYIVANKLSGGPSTGYTSTASYIGPAASS